LTGWFGLASVFALPMIGGVEEAGDWGCRKVFCCWFFFLLFDNCIWFFWKLIVLGYLWMAGAGLCFCVFLPCCDEWRGGMRGRRLGGCFLGGICFGWVGLVLGCLGLAEKYLVRVMSLWKFV
jgi:hypothetical protein